MSRDAPAPGPAELGSPAAGLATLAAALPALLEALRFAAERHRNQRRKDPEASPYINHPIALAHVLATVGGVTDVEVLQAAILHDTIEDTATTAAEIEEHFGARVAAIVVAVTDDKSLEKPMRKRLQEEHAAHASADVALVKIADKICNLRDVASAPPAHWSLERRREYFDWAVRVVERLPVVNPDLLEQFRLAIRARP